MTLTIEEIREELIKNEVHKNPERYEKLFETIIDPNTDKYSYLISERIELKDQKIEHIYPNYDGMLCNNPDDPTKIPKDYYTKIRTETQTLRVKTPWKIEIIGYEEPLFIYCHNARTTVELEKDGTVPRFLRDHFFYYPIVREMRDKFNTPNQPMFIPYMGNAQLLGNFGDDPVCDQKIDVIIHRLNYVIDIGDCLMLRYQT
jgi:hypothetical protein